ncbi:MAG: type 4a pilus biogenesis protein PilO [Acidobacteriota bacterium]
MSLKNLPLWGQISVSIVFAVTLLIVGYKVWPDFTSMQHQIEARQAQLSDLEREVRQGQAIEAKLPEFEAEIAALQAKLRNLVLILPTDTEAGDLLRWVKNLADQSNLELKVWAPGELKTVDFYKEYPVGMNIEGSYHDLGMFFDRISKYSRIINVHNVDISKLGRSDPTKTVRSSFTATTFVYDEQEGS